MAGSHGTPLHQAAVGGHFETMLALLEKGCPLDKLSSDGQSVLHFACFGGNVEMINFLVEKKLI